LRRAKHVGVWLADGDEGRKEKKEVEEKIKEEKNEKKKDDGKDEDGDSGEGEEGDDADADGHVDCDKTTSGPTRRARSA
jgi:hypothetical protein